MPDARESRRRRRIRVGVARLLEGRVSSDRLLRVWSNPLFDRAWYLSMNADVAQSGIDPEVHYRTVGVNEARDPNPMFDTQWYLATYPDVVGTMNPLDHYLLHGADEGRDPSQRFSTAYYLQHNRDVREDGINPLLHYLLNGRREGRTPLPIAQDLLPKAGARLASFWERAAPEVAPARPTTRATSTAPLAVVLHLYYPEMWPEIKGYLESLDELRLFVSLAPETGMGFEATIRADFPGADVRMFDNRGRDMGPFVEFLSDGAFDGCELVCKIHSKRSPQLAAGHEWRAQMLGELLGSAAVVHDVRSRFAADPKLGLLGPGDVFVDEDVTVVTENAIHLRELARRADAPLDFTHVSFFAGSMFWFRPAALEPLRRLNLRQADFEPEQMQIDGALQHALERFMPAAVRAAGYRTAPFEPAGRRAIRGTRIDGRTVKLIAFYLPQFHSIAENDAWWGKGFSEWAHVARSRPLFDGHLQPRLPTDLGFYDLRVPEVRQAQAALALEHGVHAFCYYYYWFDGKQLLERPLREVLSSGQPDFPFCICWANENWTRRWDGRDDEILIEQRYSMSSSRQFIRDVLPILRDRRYVRFNDRPVLLVYRPAPIPDARDVISMWREEARRAGVGELHLAAVRTWEAVDVHALGFDAEVEFPPHAVAVRRLNEEVSGLDPNFNGLIYDYDHVVDQSLGRRRRQPGKLTHPGVMLAWDNTPRRGTAANIAYGATPATYGRWLEETMAAEVAAGPGESLVFINAWNEWGEGANLEPDSQFGHGFLEATRGAVSEVIRRYQRSAA